MRIRQRPFACLLLLSLLAPTLTWAQERFLRGEVVSLGTQGDKSPEKGVEVSALGRELLALVAAGQGNAERAARLLGAAGANRGTIGTSRPDVTLYAPEHHRCERRARAALGDATYETIAAEGARLGITDAIAYALGEGLGG